MHEWLWRSWLREVGDSAYETSGLSTCMRPGAAAPSAPDLALPVSRSPDLEQHHEHVCAVDLEFCRDFLAHIESPKSDGRPPEKQRRPPRTAQFTVDDL